MLPILLTIILTIWNVLISFFLFRLIVHYNKLTKNGDNKTLKEVLEGLLNKQSDIDLDLQKINQKLVRMEKDNLFHLQKIGLVRFNPFTDTGGNQSFVLVILNDNNDGVVISSLHSRLQTRWYAKTIKEGKSLEHEFSEEEKKALNEALKSKR